MYRRLSCATCHVLPRVNVQALQACIRASSYLSQHPFSFVQCTPYFYRPPTHTALKMAYEVRWSNSRALPYFYDPSTGQSTWEAPPGVDVSTLPGAHYLQQGGGSSAPAAPSGGGKAGEIRASHILSKHQGSRRPSSWKQVRLGKGLGCALEEGCRARARALHCAVVRNSIAMALAWSRVAPDVSAARHLLASRPPDLISTPTTTSHPYALSLSSR